MKVEDMKLPRFKRHAWISQEALPPGTRPGKVFVNARDTLSSVVHGNGRARYDGNCCGCGRPLFQDIDDTLTLGVQVACAFDEFPDVPVCFECQSEQELHKALCAARPHYFTVEAMARKLGAIGVSEHIRDTVRAADPKDAVDVFRAKWCETHEHIHIIPANVSRAEVGY